MSHPQPLQRISVGVVVERRKAKSPWAEFIWRPVAALAGKPAAKPWTMLDRNVDCVTFYAGAVDVELYDSSTLFYRNNLASGSPALWVILRPTGVDPPFDIVAATADPTEGEAYTHAGNDLVEPVMMPEPVRAVVESFVATHHVKELFHKRKRDRADPEALARRSVSPKGRKR